MKYLLPVVMLAAAAWATRGEPRATLAQTLEPSSERLRPEVPWLNEEFAGEFSAIVESDPHQGLYGGEDPHAGLYDEEDPHAGLQVEGERFEPAGPSACPHFADGLTDEGLEADPHAGTRVSRPAELPEQGVARSSAQNGHTIAELYAQRSALAERSVSVRGVIVKRTDGILGESFLHLQDGSGSAAHQDNDLTITTTEDLALGETVEVEGVVRVERDLGLGYRYAVMLTGATQVAVR